MPAAAIASSAKSLRHLLFGTRLQVTLAFFLGLIQWRSPAGHKHECFPRQPLFHLDHRVQHARPDCQPMSKEIILTFLLPCARIEEPFADG